MFSINLMFYIFSTSLVICAFMVVVAQHPVVLPLLFLVGSFIFSAFIPCFYLSVSFSFLFIIIYVGVNCCFVLFIL
jgi:NADH:ubiquinone oxidoreductase subunit 6 (subunit J)